MSDTAERIRAAVVRYVSYNPAALDGSELALSGAARRSARTAAPSESAPGGSKSARTARRSCEDRASGATGGPYSG